MKKLLFVACVVLFGCGGTFDVIRDGDAGEDAESCFPALVGCREDGGCRQGRVCVPAEALRDAGADRTDDAPSVDSGEASAYDGPCWTAPGTFFGGSCPAGRSVEVTCPSTTTPTGAPPFPGCSVWNLTPLTCSFCCERFP